jgi:tRNA-splicing ligase RtcB
VKQLPDRELIYAPASHHLCEEYLSAMAAAANFSWCNRHIIGHQVRQAFSSVFDNVELSTVYDVAHNIAKREQHQINGEKKEVYMHRKGATRAFGPGHREVPQVYREVGQPVIIPGSMGTASFVLVGTQKGMETTFGSAPHGAGRTMSRHAAKKQFRGEKIKHELEKSNIYVKSASWKGIAEEAPGVYKNVEEVVEVSHQAGIGSKVARLRPIGVVKG